MTGKTFGQAVAESIKGRTALLRDTRAEIVRLLKLAYDRISVILAGQPSDYQRWVLPQVQKDIALVLKEFGDSGTTVMANAANSAWQAGLNLVDAPIRAGGGAHIIASLGVPDTDQLNAMRLFMTDRIRNISLEAANRINGELGLVVIGAQSPGDAITSVNRILGGRARGRATTIVRTELGRVFSAASFARMQQAVANGANIRKKWIKSGKVHSRPGHDAIHGVILPVDQLFEVVDFKTGEVHQLMYPHDPRAPVGETINCGCVATPTASGFEGAAFKSMVAKPDGGQWSNAELRAQAREFAAKNKLKEAYDPNQPRDEKGRWADENFVTELTGDELGQHNSTKDLRKAAMAYAERHLIGKTFTNQNSGHEVSVTRQGIKHGLARSNVIEIKLLPALPKILSAGEHMARVEDKLGRAHIFSVHKYRARVKVGAELLNVGVVTHEKAPGHEYYDHFAVSKKAKTLVR